MGDEGGALWTPLSVPRVSSPSILAGYPAPIPQTVLTRSDLVGPWRSC